MLHYIFHLVEINDFRGIHFPFDLEHTSYKIITSYTIRCNENLKDVVFGSSCRFQIFLRCSQSSVRGEQVHFQLFLRGIVMIFGNPFFILRMFFMMCVLFGDAEIVFDYLLVRFHKVIYSFAVLNTASVVYFK